MAAVVRLWPRPLLHKVIPLELFETRRPARRRSFGVIGLAG